MSENNTRYRVTVNRKNGPSYEQASITYGRHAASALNILQVTGVSLPLSQQVAQTIRRYRLTYI
jgi:hypothetical protein